MTPIEIIALAFIIGAGLKLLIVVCCPKSWMNVVKSVWKNSFLTGFVCLILAGIVFYYLLIELTIIQILATMAFTGLLAGITVASYSKEVIGVAGKLLKNRNAVKKAALSIIIWAALLIWGAYVLFA